MNNQSMDTRAKATSIFKKITSEKKYQYFALALIVVILILSVGISFSSNINSNENIQNDEIIAYVSDLENKLSSTLSKVSGVGEVAVAITVESGKETILATKKTTNETADGVKTEETPIIINGKTVIVKELYPKIIGVLIVAKGADNFSVLARIQQATISLLNIDLKQIEILSM